MIPKNLTESDFALTLDLLGHIPFRLPLFSFISAGSPAPLVSQACQLVSMAADIRKHVSVVQQNNRLTAPEYPDGAQRTFNLKVSLFQLS